jgi:hypothetical protein
MQIFISQRHYKSCDYFEWQEPFIRKGIFFVKSQKINFKILNV